MSKEVLIGGLMGRHKNVILNRPSIELVCPDSDVGLEFEFEGVRKKCEELSALYFDLKKENSLHDNGMEFVYKQPLNGMDVTTSIRLICDYAKLNKFKASMRTGIHVHLDIRDLLRTQFIGLLVYYALFEPLIYHWVGDDRDANNFCIPFYKAQGSLDQAIKITKSLFGEGQMAQLQAQQAADGYNRYAGFNLQSMRKFGSAEFRQLKTTTDTARIIDWLNIIFSLKRAAQQVPMSTAAGLLDSLIYDEPNKLVLSVFGNQLGSSLASYPDWQDELIGLGLPNALRILETTDEILVPRKQRRAKADIYSPWGDAPAPDPDQPEKNHRAIRGWEGKAFPKGEGQQLDDKIAAHFVDDGGKLKLNMAEWMIAPLQMQRGEQKVHYDNHMFAEEPMGEQLRVLTVFDENDNQVDSVLWRGDSKPRHGWFIPLRVGHFRQARWDQVKAAFVLR